MKKIVVLHTAYWQQAMGGAELQILYLIEELLTQNYRVYYIYEDKKIPFENKHNIELIPLTSKLRSKRFGDRWIYFKKEIFRNLNRIKPDGIYTRTYSSWSGFATQYALKNKIPHVWAVASDNDIPKSIEKVSLLRPRDIIAKQLMNLTINNCTEIVVQNLEQQSLLKRYYNREGILITQSSEVENENVIEKSEDLINVVWIANLKHIKQPEVFLSLVENFANDKRVRFTMIGRSSSTYLENIEKLREISNFEYLGELTNSEVNAILCKSNVLVNTSLAEGFSNTFVQAWLRKVVVISMNSNPDNILIKHNVGFVESHLNSIVTRLEFLINNKSILNEMSVAAQAYALEHHDISKNLQRITKLF